MIARSLMQSLKIVFSGDSSIRSSGSRKEEGIQEHEIFTTERKVLILSQSWDDTVSHIGFETTTVSV